MTSCVLKGDRQPVDPGMDAWNGASRCTCRHAFFGQSFKSPASPNLVSCQNCFNMFLHLIQLLLFCLQIYFYLFIFIYSWIFWIHDMLILLMHLMQFYVYIWFFWYTLINLTMSSVFHVFHFTMYLGDLCDYLIYFFWLFDLFDYLICLIWLWHYAFCGWCVCMCWNVEWVDVPRKFPKKNQAEASHRQVSSLFPGNHAGWNNGAFDATPGGVFWSVSPQWWGRVRPHRQCTALASWTVVASLGIMGQSFDHVQRLARQSFFWSVPMHTSNDQCHNAGTVYDVYDSIFWHFDHFVFFAFVDFVASFLIFFLSFF